MDGNHSHPATVRYRLNLPLALHSVSPALAALHTLRATALHPEIAAALHPTHCPKCGTFHFSGDHSSYLVGLSARKRRKHAISPHAKVLRRRCHLCGFPIDVLDHAPVQLLGEPSKIGSALSIGQAPPSGDVSLPTARRVPTTGCTPIPPLPRQSKTTAGLKDMISHEKQREDAAKSHKKRKEGHEGLAAFLKEL